MGTFPTLPVLHHNTQPDSIGKVIIIDQAFAIARKILDISIEVLQQRKAHFELQSAAVLIETEIVSEHEPKVIFSPNGAGPDLPIAEVGGDVWIVILAFFLGNARPGFKDDVE